jgi:predicted O-methyltransferase YrrM
VSDQGFAQWFSGKHLSTDWTSRYFPNWASLLAAHRDRALEVLEIGSWEGRSAIFFLRFLPHCRLTCVDTFQGNAEHALRDKWADALPHIEARFDSNLAEFADRFEKIKLSSTEALAALNAAGRKFDLAYIDGSHDSADVHHDAVLSWPMINDRGIVMFDDYEWSFFEDERRHPKLGVDTFLLTHAGQYRELHRGYQIIIEKTGSGIT